MQRASRGATNADQATNTLEDTQRGNVPGANLYLLSRRCSVGEQCTDDAIYSVSAPTSRSTRRGVLWGCIRTFTPMQHNQARNTRCVSSVSHFKGASESGEAWEREKKIKIGSFLHTFLFSQLFILYATFYGAGLFRLKTPV